MESPRPEGAPYIFLFTGETGSQYGYADGWRPDGIFAYTGEGQRGDMEFVRGNRAIRDHITDGRDLLLFEASRTKGLYRFVGCFAREDATGAEHGHTLDARLGLVRQVGRYDAASCRRR